MKTEMKIKPLTEYLPVFVLMLALTSGCMPRTVSAPSVYTLATDGQNTGQGMAVEKPGHYSPVLKLMPVRGSSPFTGTGILYRDSDHGLNSYALSRWSDAPISMLEGFLMI